MSAVEISQLQFEDFGRFAMCDHTLIPLASIAVCSGLPLLEEAGFEPRPMDRGPTSRSALGSPARHFVVESPQENPEIRTESCASPRHEALEALRWARELIANRSARPEEIAIAAASPDEWDDHLIALADMTGLDLHFVHGRKVLVTPDGQLAAALADVLLRGFSHTRIVRLASLLRRQGKILTAMPPDWARALPIDAPKLSRWNGGARIYLYCTFSYLDYEIPIVLREACPRCLRGFCPRGGNYGAGLFAW